MPAAVGQIAAITPDGHGDVVATEWFVHVWHPTRSADVAPELGVGPASRAAAARSGFRRWSVTPRRYARPTLPTVTGSSRRWSPAHRPALGHPRPHLRRARRRRARGHVRAGPHRPADAARNHGLRAARVTMRGPTTRAGRSSIRVWLAASGNASHLDHHKSPPASTYNNGTSGT